MIQKLLDNDLQEFLQSPAAFPGESGVIETITTHGAVLFLGEQTVLKVKLPVQYDYMDFSTLAERHRVCQREAELNMQTAPGLYLGVVAICQSTDGGFEIDGDGSVAEYAVRMKRFPEACVLNRIADSRQFTAELSRKLGESVVTYHQGLNLLKVDDGACRVRELIEELGRELGHLTSLSKAHQPEVLLNALTEKFAAIGPFLDRRAEAGFVRRCHGDLHLRNIVLLDGKPTPFDALEFDERLATTDVIYDLAFLLMDMLHAGLIDHANIVFNRYLYLGWSLFEDSGFAVLPLFLSIRAAIRCMVEHQASGADTAHFGTHELNAEFYFDEALKFLTESPPQLIAVGGLSGTGKSVLAQSLGPLIGRSPGAFVMRSDLERKKMFGVREEDKLPDETYTKLVSRHVYERLFDKARIALSQGHSVITDAAFIEEEYRYKLAQLAREQRVDSCFLWLAAPAKVLLDRVSSRTRDASDADVSIVERQLIKHPHVARIAPSGWTAIDAGNQKAETLRLAKSILFEES